MAKPKAKPKTKPAVKKATVKPKPVVKPMKTSPAPNKAAATPKVASSGADALWAEYWKKPDDKALLRVYADALEQAGDPRGTFIQLSMLESRTEDQNLAREKLLKKNKGDLIGPARTFLREVEFDADGLVGMARTEVDKVIEGVKEISRLHPRLILTLTSVKTEAIAKQLGKISLGGIYFIDFGWLTGTHGGCRLTDKLLAAIAPALAEVQHLQLSFSQVHNSPTPDGLAALAQHAKKLRFFSADYYVGGDCAPASAYVPALRGFPALKAVEWPSMQAADLPGIKVNTLLGTDEDINGVLRFDTAAKIQRLF